MSSWGCCTVDNGKDEQFISCSHCGKLFHYACLAIPLIEDAAIVQSWVCPQCTAAARKSTKTDSTPIRNITTGRGNKRPAYNSPPGTTSVTVDDVREIVREVFRTEFNYMFEKLSASLTVVLNKQLDPLRTQMNGINESIAFMSDRFDDIEKEQAEAKRSREDLLKENLLLKDSVEVLKVRLGLTEQRMNSVKQNMRANNIEIQCVPENRSENLMNIVMKLVSVTDSNLKECNIIRCTRTAKNNPESTRPRSIVVELSSPMIRDELLASAAKYNKANQTDKLNSSHLGFSGKSPIYVIEHLSPSNKALHAATRIKAREKGYKYVWIRAGRIFIRKNDDSSYILIKNMETVNKLT